MERLTMAEIAQEAWLTVWKDVWMNLDTSHLDFTTPRARELYFTTRNRIYASLGN